MKETCYKWIFTAPVDGAGLKARFNRLAEQGWELDHQGDGTFFFARFKRTSRKELRYDVALTPQFRTVEELNELAEHRRDSGWEPIGTINGLDVFVSMPCQEPENINDSVYDRKCLLSRGVLGILLPLLSVLFCAFVSGQKSWYLSNLDALGKIFLPPMAVCSVIWVIWYLFRCVRPAKTPPPSLFLWGRSALVCGLFLFWLLIPVSIVFDLLSVGWALGLLLAGAAIWLVSRRIEKGIAPLLLVIGCVLLGSLGLNHILPDSQLYDTGSSSWRSSLTELIHAEDLGLEDMTLLSAEYDKSGSLLVTKTSCTEEWDGFELVCERYSCLTRGLAEEVSRDLQGRFLVVQEGRDVLALRTSQEIPGAEQVMEEKLLEK
jgi:hypothetical protein